MKQAKDLIRRNSLGEFPEQRTDEWLSIRKNMITATNVSSVLNCNVYKSSYDLMVEKLSPVEINTNPTMEWGNIFEPIAIKLYEFTEHDKNNTIGYVWTYQLHVSSMGHRVPKVNTSCPKLSL